MPHLAIWQWALGAFCAFIIGVAKTGVPGLAIMVVPLMVLTVGDARQSAGWLLPVLCIADLFAVFYWRRHASAGRLLTLAPWVFCGLVAGAAALSLSERVLRPVVGGLVLLMLAAYVWRKLRPDLSNIGTHAAPYGITAGFATTVANAAGPVMNLYLLSKKLPKEEFVATGAWFFFIINLTKLPIYIWYGLIGTHSLAFDAAVAPAVMAGALTGKWVLQHIEPKVFEILVIVLTAISTLLLLR
jgi:uncharacterized membrane protein YfcA